MTESLKGCEEARTLASRKLDGELAAGDLARLESHLASCAECRAESASLERVDAVVQDAFAEHPFGDQLVRDIIRTASSRAVRVAPPVAAPRGALIKFRAGGLVAAAAAAIVLVSVGIGLWGGSTTNQPTPVSQVAILAHAHGAGLRVGNQSPNGTPLAVHEDEVVLNRSGAGTLLLEDGTRVDLRPDTAVVLHRERDGGISVVIGAGADPGAAMGEVYCEVAKQKHPFRVVTGSLSATVLGTRFLVRATGRESSVAVLEGRVRVASGIHVVVLSRDQEAVLASAQSPLIARPLTDARVQLGWNPRVLEKLPAAPVSQSAPINSSRPTTHPVEQPPVDRDLDKPVEKPEQRKK